MTQQVPPGQALWLSIFRGFAKAANYHPGRSDAIFFASDIVKGPVAGKEIPEEYTNYSTFYLADSLIKPDSITYHPSSQESYFKHMQNFLHRVNPGIQLTAEQKALVQRRLKELRDAEAAFSAEKLAALTRYRAEFPPNSPALKPAFEDWTFENARTYRILREARAVAEANYLAALEGASGNRSPPIIIKDLDNMTKAEARDGSYPGLNMRVCSKEPDLAALSAEFGAKGKVEPPKDTSYLPEYKLDGYAGMINSWIEQGASSTQQSIKVSISEGRTVNIKEFGYRSSQVQLSAVAPCVSFRYGNKDTKDYEVDFRGAKEEDVEIYIKFDEVRQIRVNPGSWNIGNPATRYPKTEANQGETLVLPSHFVFAKNLGYSLKFKNDVKSKFHQACETHKRVGGDIRVFGCSVRVGATLDKRSSYYQNVGEWNNVTGELSIKPTPNFFNASLLAVVGEVVKTV